jgi:flagellar biosynthetic protein FliS
MHTDQKDAARAYRERSIEGASPARLVRLMLEGALRAIEKACAADPTDGRSCFVPELLRADEIVIELTMAIDAEKAPETSRQTIVLYDFASARLRAALGQRDARPAREAREVLVRLHDAWKRIDEGAP